jgi:hypothetical protein
MYLGNVFFLLRREELCISGLLVLVAHHVFREVLSGDDLTT